MKTQDQVDHSINLFSMTERLLALEEAAPFQVKLFQFVDDAFSLGSSMFGLSSFIFLHRRFPFHTLLETQVCFWGKGSGGFTG